MCVCVCQCATVGGNHQFGPFRGPAEATNHNGKVTRANKTAMVPIAFAGSFVRIVVVFVVLLPLLLLRWLGREIRSLFASSGVGCFSHHVRFWPAKCSPPNAARSVSLFVAVLASEAAALSAKAAAAAAAAAVANVDGWMPHNAHSHSGDDDDDNHDSVDKPAAPLLTLFVRVCVSLG